MATQTGVEILAIIETSLPEGSPCLFIERRAFLDDGRVVEFTRSFYRGDAYDFVAELHAP